jgi:uncharacterized repeat protein (TIGR03803 family)
LKPIVFAAALVAAGITGATHAGPTTTSVINFQTLHLFSNVAPSGYQPSGELVASSDGLLYGTTHFGGVYGKGTVFAMTQAGVVTTLHDFDGTDGTSPQGLIELPTGELVGGTYRGGINDGGVLFKITKTGAFTLLHRFDATTEGGIMSSRLVRAASGKLFGATDSGGTTVPCGSVFSVTASGTFAVTYRFPADGSMGCGFKGTLIQAKDGNLYGTAQDGGTNKHGTVFKVSVTGVPFTRLVDFPLDTGWGINPSGGLVQVSDTSFFGVANQGGTGANGGHVNGVGTIFRVTTTGVLTTLHNFASNLPSTDGVYPQARLTIGLDGFVYGTTTAGGIATTGGTVFRLMQDGSSYVTRHSFTTSEGDMPTGGVVQAPWDHALYGVTPQDGLTNGSSGSAYVMPGS